MNSMDQAKIDELVARVIAEYGKLNRPAQIVAPTSQSPAAPSVANVDTLAIDLADPTTAAMRARPGIAAPANAEALRALMDTTPARIGVGRAGTRYRNAAQLLFWADHAITQDALFREIDPVVLQQFNLFTVASRAQNRQEYLLRPDLGRLLSDDARKTLAEKCVKEPDVQIFVADGLATAALEHNLRDIFPILQQGLQQANLKMGTPFYVTNGRVGLLNDVNTIVHARVCVVLIGERPGLGRVDSMSAYLSYRPQADTTDADRDVVCNIYHGGTNPLEAGAYVVELIKKTLQYQASGIKLKLASAEKA